MRGNQRPASSSARCKETVTTTTLFGSWTLVRRRRQCSGRASWLLLLLLLLLALVQTDRPPLAPLPLARSRDCLTQLAATCLGLSSLAETQIAAASNPFRGPFRFRSVRLPFPFLGLVLNRVSSLIFSFSLFPLSSFSLLLCSPSMTLVASECTWFLDC